MQKYIAEMIGTMFLVMFGCGVASTSDSTITIAFAFGLALMAMIYTFGTISGGHFNPAVTIANFFSGSINLQDLIIYIIVQTIGAFIGTLLLALIFGWDIGFGVNYVKEPYQIYQGIIFEIVFSFIFVLTILAVTSKNSYKPIAGLVIGLTLTAIHLVGIPITGTSLNPARSLAPAMISGNITAISELWIFIVMPTLGAILAAVVWQLIFANKK